MGYPYFRKPPLNNPMQNRQCVLSQSAMIIHDTPHFHGRFGCFSSPKQMEAKKNGWSKFFKAIDQWWDTRIRNTGSMSIVMFAATDVCKFRSSTSKFCVLKLQVSVSKTSINTSSFHPFPSLHRADLEFSEKTPRYISAAESSGESHGIPWYPQVMRASPILSPCSFQYENYGLIIWSCSHILGNFQMEYLG